VPGLLARPELAARFAELQTLPRTPIPTGEALVAEIRRQIADWTAVARQFNIVVS
jgi:tripartite-type tricarboxylate transporter receptor subunit TctC